MFERLCSSIFIRFNSFCFFSSTFFPIFLPLHFPLNFFVTIHSLMTRGVIELSKVITESNLNSILLKNSKLELESNLIEHFFFQMFET